MLWWVLYWIVVGVVDFVERVSWSWYEYCRLCLYVDVDVHEGDVDAVVDCQCCLRGVFDF